MDHLRDGDPIATGDEQAAKDALEFAEALRPFATEYHDDNLVCASCGARTYPGACTQCGSVNSTPPFKVSTGLDQTPDHGKMHS